MTIMLLPGRWNSSPGDGKRTPERMTRLLGVAPFRRPCGRQLEEADVQKPGSFNLDRVMEAVSVPHKGANQAPARNG
jgi:hypothetical protein